MPTLDFKGKQFVYAHHHSVPFRELVLDEKKSLSDKPCLDDNLIIHGDNLHALKALLPQYAGKIKCIYIDPPYNTGNEGWCYNDNVNSPTMKEWLKKEANPVDKEDMERHDKWLCMMYPRLKLLHELLADDGVIFVSIDDNEVHHLRLLMDEIFGEENFVGQAVWEKMYTTKNDSSQLSQSHEYIFVYLKNFNDGKLQLLPRTEEMDARYINPDKDPRGAWKPIPLYAKGERKNGRYPVISPRTGKEWLPEPDKHWLYSEVDTNEMIADNRIYFGKDGNAQPNVKRFLTEVQQGTKGKSLWKHTEVGSNDSAKRELKEIFSSGAPFDYPKPTTLIKRILQLGTSKGGNDIILDSFAGSGTTAHAVLDLNSEDGGNRKFILVQIDEEVNKETEPYKAGYKTVIDITAERVRRVIKGVPTAKDEKLKNGLGGSFSYCELGEAIEIEKILTGESLPTYEALARYVFYTATGKSLAKDLSVKSNYNYFVGETDLYQVFLIYEPEIAYLRSNDSALNAEKLKTIAEIACKKEKLVYATAKYMGQNELKTHNITFCQLPYAIHKITGK